ncbi:hypothetical protein B4U84_28275 [Westiellopsis prolifica IICB1]|nr:hypothetical protein B4U84_28275 [Westiellopsis prolifica IICB1]
MKSNSLQTLPENPQPLRLDWVAVIFFTTIHALALLAPWFFSWSALGVAVFISIFPFGDR